MKFSFHAVGDASAWVYHYTSLRNAIEFILPQGNLKLGLFADVHDPRESKDWSFMVSSRGDESPTSEEFFRIQREATALAKGNCRLLCMTRDDPRACEQTVDAVFFRGYARPRMWAQYAGGHTGVCLVFDRGKLDQQIREKYSKATVFAGAVTYVNRAWDEGPAFHLPYADVRGGMLATAVERKVQQFYETYFLTKAEDWASEIEWRWVVRSEGPGPGFVDIRGSLQAIVLGCDTAHVYDPAVLPLGRGLKVPVSRLIWMNGRPIATPVARGR